MWLKGSQLSKRERCVISYLWCNVMGVKVMRTLLNPWGACRGLQWWCWKLEDIFELLVILSCNFSQSPEVQCPSSLPMISITYLQSHPRVHHQKKLIHFFIFFLVLPNLLSYTPNSIHIVVSKLECNHLGLCKIIQRSLERKY